MAKITYADKSPLNINASVADINKCNASDLNEIKSKVNINTPTGVIHIFAGSTAPSGWLICDGSAVSRTTYADLFAVIGTTYGSGDDSTTFNLPNLKGRVAVGLDSDDTDFDTLGETGGSKYLQAHNHTAGKYDNMGINNAAVASGTNHIGIVASGSSSTSRITTNSTGAGDSGNLQPFIVMNYIISY